MSSLYKINTNSVNTRDDWKHRRISGGLTERTAETFPGDAAIHLGIGEKLAAGVEVVGFLQADTLVALNALFDTEEARMAETSLSTVEINGVTFSNQHLASFEVASGDIPFRDTDGSVRQSRRVRYVWQGVKP